MAQSGRAYSVACSISPATLRHCYGRLSTQLMGSRDLHVTTTCRGRVKVSESEETAGVPQVELPKAPSSHESASFLHDPIAMKFISCMMWDGKKALSQRIFKESLERVKRLQLAKVREGEESLEVNPMTVFHSAMANTRPIIGTTKVTRGGKHYHVPVGVHPNRQQFLAIKWLIVAARERSGRGMAEKLALELLDAHNNEGTVIKKKQDLHRLAEANRAFAHFRW